MTLQQKFHSMVLNVSPRCLAPLFVAIVFANTVVYLVWTSPASHTNLRRRHSQDRSDHHQGSFSHRNSSFALEIEHGIINVRDHQFVLHWKGVWVPNRKIQVMSSIHDIHHMPTQQGVQETRVLLPAFLKHSSNRKFYCCFHWSEDLREFVQVPARLDYIDLRYVVELQAATFECIVKTSEMNLKEQQRVKYVSFSSESCSHNPTLPMVITTPARRQFEFAVCTKVAYGRLDPRRLLEWFVFMEVMGASKVLTFYNNVHNDTMNVFKHFVKSGLLELIEFDPRNRGGMSVKYTVYNAQTRQAHHDKTLAVRDCQYRLGGYDHVMTVDFDELPVPTRPFGSINWVLEALFRNYTDTAGFLMEPLLLPPDWLSRRDPALYHWQFTKAILIKPYCNKWVYSPPRTWMASTHDVIAKRGYKTNIVPREHLHFLHFRTCKPEWHKLNCTRLSQNASRDDDSLLRFRDRVLHELRKLPLEALLPAAESAKYVLGIRNDPRGRGKNFDDSILFEK